MKSHISSIIAGIAFMVYPPHPNPFNPLTTISLALPEDSRVHLSVYDITGRLVATLVNGWRDAGVHEVRFDGSNMATGMYFCRFTAEGTNGDNRFSGVNKMLLMK